MDRCFRRIVAIACLVAAAGCTPEQEGEAPVTAASTAAVENDPAPATGSTPSTTDAPPASAPTTSAVAAGRWFLQESDPPRAVWGVPGSEGMLVFSCDRASGQLLLERQAIGVPEDVRVVSIDADGTRIDYPAERAEPALAPLLLTPIALDAPILDRLLGARRVVVTAGADAITTLAPGASLRAVVDACRAGAPG